MTYEFLFKATIYNYHYTYYWSSKILTNEQISLFSQSWLIQKKKKHSMYLYIIQIYMVYIKTNNGLID